MTKRTMMKTQLNLESLKENLVDYLPEYQRAYSKTMAYETLCECLLDLLKSPRIVRDSRLIDFIAIKQQFDHMTDHMPPPDNREPWQRKITAEHQERIVRKT